MPVLVALAVLMVGFLVLLSNQVNLSPLQPWHESDPRLLSLGGLFDFHFSSKIPGER